jgi:hypothetical protein
MGRKTSICNLSPHSGAPPRRNRFPALARWATLFRPPGSLHGALGYCQPRSSAVFRIIRGLCAYPPTAQRWDEKAGPRRDALSSQWKAHSRCKGEPAMKQNTTRRQSPKQSPKQAPKQSLKQSRDREGDESGRPAVGQTSVCSPASAGPSAPTSGRG